MASSLLRYCRPSVTRRLFSAASESQKSLWQSYQATGRGSIALFASIDSDHDLRVQASDLERLYDSLEGSDMMPERAYRLLHELADDHPIDLATFQSWLILATQQAGYAPIQPLYDTHPYIGNRSTRNLEREHVWNKSSMSQSLRKMQYAVRGSVVMRADELAAEGREILYTNVGNPHSVGQQPITYYRQVLALCDLPAKDGVDHPSASTMFPPDVLGRAREMRDIVGPGGTGAYTNSQGLIGVRQHVAEFIEKRDGHPSYEGDIFLTDGASSGIELILTGLIAGDQDAIMIPIPQYPIYSALITRLGGRQVGYELDEDLGWTVTEEELNQRLALAKAKGLNVKGLAMINPGNPTGQVMSREDLETICRFCAANGIVLLADEVYQRNVYAEDKEFLSAKRIAVETPGCMNLELVSFHSTSKGLIGECGRRGGYMELHGIDPYVQSQIYKLASSGLCSGVAGQLMTSLMVKGPEPEGESYALFSQEESQIFESLKRRAQAVVEGLNSIEGIECQPAQGAMYAFPKVTVPDKALQAAKELDITVDTLYALSLLDETGICVVPASGFGQKAGRVGFRTTFLPPEDKLLAAIGEFARHHQLFCEKYS